MIEKPPPALDPLDLSARARLGRLSRGERLTFEHALATDAALRAAHELGRDLDRLSSVRSGDEALVERAVARALGAERRRGSRRFSRFALLLAAGFAIASAAAAARGFVFGLSDPDSAASAAPAAQSAGARLLQGRAGPSAPRGVAQVEPALAPPSASPRAAAPSVRTQPPSQARSSAEDTAEGLFRRAGAARRAGDFEAARALYLELQNAFPESNEAGVSRVSLGKLYLGAGRAREAEREFSRYLRAGAGDLREEALVGRADALAALGQSAEERNVWQELLRRYPSSVYAARARARSDALGGALPVPER
jgi:TolA-binding protein